MIDSNLERARAAMSHLAARYERQERGLTTHPQFDYEPFFDLMAEDVVFAVACPPDTPGFGGEACGKRAVVALFTEEDPNLVDEMEVHGPLEYFDGGDRVVVLGALSYRIRRSGRRVLRKPFAYVIEFRDGLIVRHTEITDMSVWRTSSEEDP